MLESGVAHTRAGELELLGSEIVVVVTWHPYLPAAWTANPPQPVPISST